MNFDKLAGRAPSGAPQFGSMRMKVIEEKVVDGHKVKVLPPGYADGASPQKNVTVRSEQNYVSVGYYGRTY